MSCAVKYCGGCRPTYDRVGWVRRLEAQLGQRLGAPEAGVEYDVLYVVCGCTARCANYSGISARQIILIDGTGQEII